MEEALVKEIVSEVMKKWAENTTFKKPQLLVSNASDDSKINELKKQWHVVTMLPTAENIPTNINDIVFLDVNQDLLVKGALGIADTPESKLLAQAILKGLRITFVPSPSWQWLLDSHVFDTAKPEYVRQLLNYKTRLERFGVNMLLFTQLVSNGVTANTGEKTKAIHEKLLTQKDVAKAKGKKILIRPSTIVTPLARDSARELGKTICILDSKGVEVSCK